MEKFNSLSLALLSIPLLMIGCAKNTEINFKRMSDHFFNAFYMGREEESYLFTSQDEFDSFVELSLNAKPYNSEFADFSNELPNDFFDKHNLIVLNPIYVEFGFDVKYIESTYSDGVANFKYEYPSLLPDTNMFPALYKYVDIFSSPKNVVINVINISISGTTVTSKTYIEEHITNL